MQIPSQIPIELKEKVDRELQPGERISWMDMPIPKYFTPKSKAMFIFAIPWTLFAIFWISGAADFKIPDFKEPSDLFPLFGLPFLFIGLALLLSPFYAHYKATKTVYVITDRRAIIFEGGFSTTIRSYLHSELSSIYRNQRADETGDIILSIREWHDSDGDKKTEVLGFLRIRDPKTVEQELRSFVKQTGTELAVNPPTDIMKRELEGGFRVRKTDKTGVVLPSSNSSVRAGKIIVILVLSCLVGYFHYSGSLEDYKKGQSLTLEEYIEGFDAHREQLLKTPGPLWMEILVFSLMAGLVFGCYELLGRGVGWVYWRTIQSKKAGRATEKENFPDPPKIV